MVYRQAAVRKRPFSQKTFRLWLDRGGRIAYNVGRQVLTQARLYFNRILTIAKRTIAQLPLCDGSLLSVVPFRYHNDKRENRQKDHDHFIIRHAITSVLLYAD